MKRTFATLTVASAMVLGMSGIASAETAVGGTPRVNEGPNLDGAGTEVSDASADGETGELMATAEATGGNSFLPILIRGFLPPNLIPGQGPSTAAANAGVDRAFEVAPGTYEVTVSYENAQGAEDETGRGTATAYVQTSAAAPGQLHPAIAFDDLPDAPGTVERTFVIEVPEGENTISVLATAVALSSADGRGNGADAQALVGQTTFEVTAIG